MTIRNLDGAVRPKSVAVIGASARFGSVGEVVLRNIVNGGFEGDIWPVNPKYADLQGLDCYADTSSLPGVPDLGIIMTPPGTVPGIVSDLAAKGCRAAVVITAGITADNGLRQAMLDRARPHVFRIIGPNTLGLAVPPLKLNASFSHMAAAPGNIALLSQSGAIATALIDWAADNNVGFSQVVSLGDMADVDVGDYLDMLAGDSRTGCIVLYLESIPNPRKFMSAARAAARIKPVIAIKSGRHEAAAKAAATHTGALSGVDQVVDAALRRAGILRVDGLGELFDAAETLARFRPLARSRVAFVTNGGGAGVLAVDRLADVDGELAELAPGTISALDRALPPTWSRSNPVDIIGDAPPARYAAAITQAAADPGTDVIVVLNCPTGLASPVEAARTVASLTEKGMIRGKPVLTCWLGQRTAQEGRRILQDAGVASFETPSGVADAISHLSDWSKAQQALSRVPSGRGEDSRWDREAAAAVLRNAAADGRKMLTEPEAKAVIAAYGIPVPEIAVVRMPTEAADAAGSMLRTCDKVAVKLLSKTITHKSDVGGVVLGLSTARAAGDAAAEISRRVSEVASPSDIAGFTVQPMVERPDAQELILGVSRDPIFGPVMLFGAGGIAVEVINDTAIGLPPLDDVLAGDLIGRTRVGRLLEGFRDRRPANRGAIQAALTGLSQLVVDFPGIAAVDINPLLADDAGVIALDARIGIDLERIDEPGPNPDLVIRPWPAGWEREVMLNGFHYLLRPIKPSDITLYSEFFAKTDPADIRLRFLAPRRNFPDEMLVRLTQLDYDRDMAFVALDAAAGSLAGVVRLSCDPDHVTGEYGLIVRTDLQGQGLGWALLSLIIDYARADGVRRIEGVILSENARMLAMCREFGFSVKAHPDDTGLRIAMLDLR